MIYTTKAGDRLDQIVYDYYGSISPITSVLDENPHLKDEIYPAGINITLPDMDDDSNDNDTINARKLWDD